MGQRLKKIMSLFTFNFKEIVLFELFYKLMAWLVYTPVLLLLFRLSLQFSGYGFITSENFLSYLLRPSTLIIILILFALFSLLLFAEMSGLVFGFHASNSHHKISPTDLLSLSIKSLLKLMMSNSLIFCLVLIGILMFWFNLKGNYFPNLIPSGLLDDYVVSNRLWMILFAVFGILILGGCVRWIYCPHYYHLSKMSFISSIKASIEKTKSEFLIHDLVTITWYVLMIISNLLLHMLGFSLIAALTGTMNHLLDWVTIIKILLSFFVTILILPVPYSYISERYYEGEVYDPIKIFEPISLKSEFQLKRMMIILLLVFGVTGGSVFTQANLYPQTLNLLFIMNKPDITAHRGYSAIAPENTLAAVELAIEHDADYIEVDVQKTKDNVLVLFHDKTLRRMAGVNKKISDLTYEELSKIDIGSSFHELFYKSRVPTLEEILSLCAGKVKLNIELKSSEDDLGQLVVDMVTKYGLQDKVVITGADYEAIKRVKEYNEKIMVGYIASALYGDISEMEEVDVFSLRSSFITAELVNEIHRNGKLVYAWTVNDLDETRRLMEIGVDNIITDYVEHTFEVKASLVK